MPPCRTWVLSSAKGERNVNGSAMLRGKAQRTSGLAARRAGGLPNSRREAARFEDCSSLESRAESAGCGPIRDNNSRSSRAAPSSSPSASSAAARCARAPICAGSSASASACATAANPTSPVSSKAIPRSCGISGSRGDNSCARRYSRTAVCVSPDLSAARACASTAANSSMKAGYHSERVAKGTCCFTLARHPCNPYTQMRDRELWRQGHSRRVRRHRFEGGAFHPQGTVEGRPQKVGHAGCGPGSDGPQGSPLEPFGEAERGLGGVLEHPRERAVQGDLQIRERER